MKRIIGIIIIAILLVGLIPASAVWAEQPNGHHAPFETAGNIMLLTSQILGYEIVDGSLVATVTETGNIDGTLSGIWENEYEMTVNLIDGTTTIIGGSVMNVTVDGLPGTITTHFEMTGRFFNSDMTFALFSGQITILSGTGALSHLQGAMVSDTGFGVPGATDWFTYAGTLYFDPHIEKE